MMIAAQPDCLQATPRIKRVAIYSDMGDVVYAGDVITIWGELIGFDKRNVTLQWQCGDGYSWMDVPGATSLSHSFIATYLTVNCSWRLSVIEKRTSASKHRNHSSAAV